MRRRSRRAGDAIYREISRAMQRAVDNARRHEVAMVCPDGFACTDPLCTAARAAVMRTGDWRDGFCILYPGETHEMP